MGQVLYEASFKFNFFFLVPLLLMVIGLIHRSFAKRISLESLREWNPWKAKWFKTQEEYDRYQKLFFRLFFVSAALFFALDIFVSVNQYQKTVGAYRRGEYEVVEGYVENFEPRPWGQRGDESFEIDGVTFFYSNIQFTQGYNKTKAQGGVITGDGQHLKIGYVFLNKYDGNVIVYIEELP